MIPKSHVTGTMEIHQSVISNNMTKTQQSIQEKQRFPRSMTCCKVFSVTVAKQSVLQSVTFASLQPYSGWISVRTHGFSLAANRRVKTVGNSPVQ